MVTTNVLIILSCFALALLVTWAVFPSMFRFAMRHEIVDYPAKRKLQRQPIPAFGGVTVAVGMVVPWVVCTFLLSWHVSPWLFVFIPVMLLFGVVDDMRDLSARVRMCLELLIVGLYIGLSHMMIGGFHGLWGINALPLYISIPLSVIAGVGIINSINMIDGVDGYSSGFCIVACALFAALFAHVGEYTLCCFMAICIGALIPFRCHNVFGFRTKMYIGDGGTLMLGAVMSAMVFCVLQDGSPVDALQAQGFSSVAFCLAVLCIPVFDTLRVMCSRIRRGVSPFSPDKTHLHHLFLELGFSHIGTATVLILTNLLIVFCWWLGYLLGASLEVQLYIVVAAGILTTFVFYAVGRNSIRSRNAFYRLLARLGAKTHIENGRFWAFMQRLADGKE